MNGAVWFTRMAALVAVAAPFLALSSASADSASSVAQKLANPNAALGFFAFPIDYVSYKGDLPDAGDQEAFKMAAQPSLPYPISKDTNLFLRPLIPVHFKQPIFDGNGWHDSHTELGDNDFDTSITGGQYFFTYNLKNAWRIQIVPTRW